MSQLRGFGPSSSDLPGLPGTKGLRIPPPLLKGTFVTTIYYHVAHASQAKHGSFIDRGANGGLSGSDVRVLSRSSRKSTVTGIHGHEPQGLDVVQCAALVEANHGIVNLIMNDHACYGKGHTIHSSGQIEGFKTQLIIGLSKLVANRGSAPLMAMPCPWC